MSSPYGSYLALPECHQKKLNQDEVRLIMPNWDETYNKLAEVGQCKLNMHLACSESEKTATLPSNEDVSTRMPIKQCFFQSNLERYRYGCLCIRHILLLIAIILLSYTLVNLLCNYLQQENFDGDRTTEQNFFEMIQKLEDQPIGKLSSIDAKSHNLIERQISSTKDLKNLDGCSKIIVQDIYDELPTERRRLTTSVETLAIKGAITEEWMQFFLKIFPSVTDLSIDINELCIGSTVERRSELPKLRLDNVEYLSIENSKLCPLLTWVMTWDMPNVKKIEITNTDLNSLTFGPLLKFLEKNSGSINSVVISRSNLCSECLFPEDLKDKVRAVDEVKVDEIEDYAEDYEFDSLEKSGEI